MYIPIILYDKPQINYTKLDIKLCYGFFFLDSMYEFYSCLAH